MPRPVTTFLKSCGALANLPPEGVPEVALLGRSNVGKSSLLNSLASTPGLARASRTPGRTRLLNYFGVTGLGRRASSTPALYLVDCPGYGYAKVARATRIEWSQLIEPYLETRAPLRLCVLLVDAMLPPQPLDLEMRLWLRRLHRPVQLVATKCDRLSGNQRTVALRRLETAFLAPPLPFSAVTGAGTEALWAAVLAG